MIFETERLILRPWQESDAEDLYRYASDPQVGPIAGWPVHTSAENSLEIIKEVLSQPETYAVVLKSEGHAVGSIGLMIGEASNIELPNDEGEIGYWIGVPYWGQSLIPEAVNELLRYGFEELALNKIWCGYFDSNTKSKRVQEKCGFTYHHTNENIPWPLMDDIRTEHITCLPKEKWQQLKLENAIKIGFGNPDDIDSWMVLVWKVRDSFPGLETEKALADHKSTVIDFMARKEAICAKEDEKVIGALLLLKDCNELCYLAVDPDYRRMHIADKLFSFMLKVIDNSKPITVSTYRNNDPKGKAAIAFYEKNGFKADVLTEEFGYPCQRYIYTFEN